MRRRRPFVMGRPPILNASKRAEIRRRYFGGREKQKALAFIYGISQATVSRYISA